jgi:hypothetical protein
MLTSWTPKAACLGTGQNRTHMIYVSEDEQRIVTTNVSSGTVSIIAQEPIHMPGPPPGMRRVPQLLPHRPAERARALRAMRRASRDLGSSAGPAREDSREVRGHAARPTGNRIGVPVAISSTNSPKRWACLAYKPTIPGACIPIERHRHQQPNFRDQITLIDNTSPTAYHAQNYAITATILSVVYEVRLWCQTGAIRTYASAPDPSCNARSLPNPNGPPVRAPHRRTPGKRHEASGAVQRNEADG